MKLQVELFHGGSITTDTLVIPDAAFEGLTTPEQICQFIDDAVRDWASDYQHDTVFYEIEEDRPLKANLVDRLLDCNIPREQIEEMLEKFQADLCNSLRIPEKLLNKGS